MATRRLLEPSWNDLLSMESGWEEIQVSDSQRDPASWGHLVMARANTGEVLEMDPVIFWHNIAIHFRMKGDRCLGSGPKRPAPPDNILDDLTKPIARGLRRV